jgi:hypothetical protein
MQGHNWRKAPVAEIHISEEREEGPKLGKARE